MPDVQIDVEGLNEFRKALKATDKAFVKELGQEYKIIGRMIQSGAAQRAAALGGIAAKSADAVKASASTTALAVKLSSGSKTPWAFGAEFGGGKYGAGNPKPTGGYTTQFKPWKGNGPEAGYFLYPTIRAESAHIIEEFDKAIERVAAHAFPDH